MRRLAAGSIVVMLLSLAAWWVVPSPAGAVATPWTWVRATGSGFSSASGADTTATCPVGYLAVTGGVQHGTAYVRSQVATGPSYSVDTITRYGLNDAAIVVTVWCALSSQVAGQVVDRTLITDHANGSGGGYGLGDFACGGDMTPLSASLTWNSGGSDVHQSGPETIGGTNEWFVTASGSSTSDSLDVRLLCVANADLLGANWVTQSQTAGADGARETVTAACPDRQRLVTGGEHIDSISGYGGDSYPAGPQTWRTASADVPPNDTLSVSVLCVPAGDPVANFTAGPYNPTNSRTATFIFTATDPSAVSRASNWCFLNTVYLGPCNGSYQVTGLTEGQNVFAIEAVTDDGRGGAPTEKDLYFQVDLTKPTLTLAAPPAFTLGKTANLRATGTDISGINHYHWRVTAHQASGIGRWRGYRQPGRYLLPHHDGAAVAARASWDVLPLRRHRDRRGHQRLRRSQRLHRRAPGQL